jgi:hypothetical protein
VRLFDREAAASASAHVVGVGDAFGDGAARDGGDNMSVVNVVTVTVRTQHRWAQRLVIGRRSLPHSGGRLIQDLGIRCR